MNFYSATDLKKTLLSLLLGCVFITLIIVFVLSRIETHFVYQQSLNSFHPFSPEIVQKLNPKFVLLQVSQTAGEQVSAHSSTSTPIRHHFLLQMPPLSNHPSDSSSPTFQATNQIFRASRTTALEMSPVSAGSRLRCPSPTFTFAFPSQRRGPRAKEHFFPRWVELEKIKNKRRGAGTRRRKCLVVGGGEGSEGRQRRRVHLTSEGPRALSCARCRRVCRSFLGGCSFHPLLRVKC